MEAGGVFITPFGVDDYRYITTLNTQGYGSFEPNDANGNPLPNGTYVVELKKGPYSYGTKQIIINR